MTTLSSCEKIEQILPIGGGMCMYGTPTAYYDVDLTVTDEQGNAISGIKVANQHGYTETTTDTKGKAVLSTSAFPNNLELTVEDIDGEANGGEFETVTVKEESLTIKKTKKGDGAWNSGTFSAKGTVKMVKKK